jgi:hypothetical protein
MVLGVFAFLAAVTLPSPGPRARPAPTGLRKAIAASDLYSARARRRLAAYLRMRLLELRKLGLERAADVVERRIPVEELLRKR